MRLYEFAVVCAKLFAFCSACGAFAMASYYAGQLVVAIVERIRRW